MKAYIADDFMTAPKIDEPKPHIFANTMLVLMRRDGELVRDSRGNVITFKHPLYNGVMNQVLNEVVEILFNSDSYPKELTHQALFAQALSEKFIDIMDLIKTRATEIFEEEVKKEWEERND